MNRPKTSLIHMALAASCFAAFQAAFASEQEPLQGLPADSVAALIARLEHPEFSVREQASEQLLAAGAATIPTLVDAALQGPPEVATRALQVLEGHLVSIERTTFEPADDALQELAESDQGTVAVGAASILARHGAIREERGVAALRELGATVTYDVDGPESQQWRGGIIMAPREMSESRGLRPRDISLGSDWKGGIEGLKYLRRLSHWRDLKLYVVRTSGVPLAEAQKLAAVLPGLDVQERGAYLGISSSPSINTEICIVGNVLPDGPAGRAGLQERDIIRQVNGEPVGSFNHLVEKLKEYDAGEQVTMTVIRNDFRTDKQELVTINVELGKWDLPNLTEAAQRYLQDTADSEAARTEDPLDDHDEPVPTEAIPTFER